MKRSLNFLTSFSLLILLSSGCATVDKLKEVFSRPLSEGEAATLKRHPGSRGELSSGISGRENDTGHAIASEDEGRRDPTPPAMKEQSGIHYDPIVFEQGAYRPDNLENMINSKGFNGVAQQTFAEAGGDTDVDIDRSGKLMAFSTTRYSRNPDICLQSVKGKAVTLHTSDPADDMMPKFSPDGKYIAWCSNRYGNWDILVSPTNRTAKTRPQQVTTHTEDDIHPTWTPDAVWGNSSDTARGALAFSRYSATDGLWRIWVVDIKTRSLSAITEGLFPEFRPVVDSSGGNKTYTLLYQKNRNRDIPWFSVWKIKVVMNSNGTIEVASAPTEIVANDKWAAINPCWSPGGSHVAFATVRKSPSAQWQARIYKADDIWVVGEDGNNLVQITSHSAPDWNPSWAGGDGRGDPGRIFFASLRNGHDNIWSVSPVVTGLSE